MWTWFAEPSLARKFTLNASVSVCVFVRKEVTIEQKELYDLFQLGASSTSIFT